MKGTGEGLALLAVGSMAEASSVCVWNEKQGVGSALLRVQY